VLKIGVPKIDPRLSYIDVVYFKQDSRVGGFDNKVEIRCSYLIFQNLNIIILLF